MRALHCPALAALALAAAAALAGPAGAAPTLFTNVHGYTLTAAALHSFDALCFEHGKVIAAGDAATLRKQCAGARRVDGGGRTLLPGLIDAHGHVLALGLENVRVRLEGSRTLEEAQQRIARYAGDHPDSAWVLGAGWNQEIWKLGRFPDASELDAVVSDRPAALERVDGHAVWLNSRALRAAGITRDTPDPQGGRIERDADGKPTGVLVDKATSLVNPIVPRPSSAETRAALRAAARELNAVGLTSVADANATAATIALYRDMADHGELTVRVYAMIGGVGNDFQALAKAGPLLGYSADHLTVRAVKLFADGALGSRGAALLAPYSDQPGSHGLLFMSDSSMQAAIEIAMKAGYQVNVHAIGDAANRQVLDAFAAAYRVVDGRALRNRIEHAQVVAPEDIPRFKALDLVASMQPTHATSDMNMAEDRIGGERLKGAYAWRSFLAQGTRIAGGSDFPVESPNPFFGLYSAVTRTDHAGQPVGGWHAEQSMTLTEAFRAFTLDAAFADHAEQSIGSLESGKWADFILVDRDPFKGKPADLWKTQVEQTWVAGEQVYSRAAQRR